MLIVTFIHETVIQINHSKLKKKKTMTAVASRNY